MQDNPLGTVSQVNHFAVEALARAEIEMQMGFTEVALAYALISLAHSALNDEERAAVEEARVDMESRRRHKI